MSASGRAVILAVAVALLIGAGCGGHSKPRDQGRAPARTASVDATTESNLPPPSEFRRTCKPVLAETYGLSPEEARRFQNQIATMNREIARRPGTCLSMVLRKRLHQPGHP